MSALWIVQVSAENGGSSFNVIVYNEERSVAEMTAESAVSADGWSDVRVLRSGMVAEDRLHERNSVFRDAATAARAMGWAIIRYRPTI
ncbi:hypothetical protein [Brevundimonas halotolerans]|uniref:Uncharacterized protein n=1 Tax=Brevundimonas halotolerans TaxID=69670 RepID=A0A7W9E618_9CAUL|nr:hypothetical protein [Brevundimonas halotolerans]MBB5659468.1 hypothetical protein [Brevundimonas halotolerans]